MRRGRWEWRSPELSIFAEGSADKDDEAADEIEAETAVIHTQLQLAKRNLVAAGRNPSYPDVPLDDYSPDGCVQFFNKDFPGLQCIHWDRKVGAATTTNSCMLFVVNDFLNEHECSRLAGISEGYELSTAGNLNRRSSTSRLASYEEAAAIQDRVSRLVNLPPQNFEKLKVTKYAPDQKFGNHDDAHAPFKSVVQPYISKGCTEIYSNRVFALIMYLNDVTEGGGTTFKYLSATKLSDPQSNRVTVRPKQGMALLFPTAYLPTAPKQVPTCCKEGVYPGNKIWCMNHCGEPAVDPKAICQQWGYHCQHTNGYHGERLSDEQQYSEIDVDGFPATKSNVGLEQFPAQEEEGQSPPYREELAVN